MLGNDLRNHHSITMFTLRQKTGATLRHESPPVHHYHQAAGFGVQPVSSQLRFQILSDRKQIVFKIIEVFSDHAKHFAIINLPVQMDKKITESGHFAHSYREILFQGSQFTEDLHAIGVIFWTASPFPGCQVIADVERGLCGKIRRYLALFAALASERKASTP